MAACWSARWSPRFRRTIEAKRLLQHDSVVRLQLEQSIADVSFQGVLADMQVVRYDFVSATLRDELQHFHFSLRQGLLCGVLSKCRGHFRLHASRRSRASTIVLELNYHKRESQMNCRDNGQGLGRHRSQPERTVTGDCVEWRNAQKLSVQIFPAPARKGKAPKSTLPFRVAELTSVPVVFGNFSRQEKRRKI